MNPTSQSIDPEKWQFCIDQLYDAVGREQQLAQALGAFRPFVDARGVAFITIPDVRHPATSHTGSVGVDEIGLVEYHTHFNVHDEWVLAANWRSDYGLGATYRGSELVPRAQLRRSYFWNGFLVRHGINDILTSLVEAPHREGPASFITFHRHSGQRPFSAADCDVLRALSPHLRQVLRLHRRLSPALALGATLRELLQRLDHPVLFLDAEARLTDCNPAATSALAGPAGWLRSVGGRLQVAVAGTWQGIAPQLQLLRTAGHLQLALLNSQGRDATLDLRLVQGAAQDTVAIHPALAVCTLTLNAADPAQALRTRHGLTAAEARVAVQIAQGRTASEIAAAGGVAMSTVRTHIAAALSKLGLARQAQLVAHVMAL